jgi:NAD-dependent deacetylase
MVVAALASWQIEALDGLVETIQTRRPMVAFTGAGISTESGIPDYRGPNGLWTTGPAKPLTFDNFMADPEVRRDWWRSLPERVAQGRARQPNAGHEALVRLERADVLAAVITQNIDSLHLAAGSSLERVIELHGNGRQLRCTRCGRLFPVDDFLPLVGRQDDPEPCPACGGILKSATIAFGEAMPQRELRLGMAIAREAGVMLVVGSTLMVNPAARIPIIAKESSAYLAILNQGSTALDDVADFVLDVPAGPALTYLAERVIEEPRGAG